MVRGYIRREKVEQDRQTDAWRRTRILATILLNAHRGENDPAITPEEFMPLEGDPLPEAPHQYSAEEVEAEFARLTTLDADLL